MPAERGTYSTRWPFGIGRQQVHLDLGDHVAAHRNPVRLRQRRDLPPRRHAADPGQVEDDHVDGPRLEERPEGVQVIEVLAGRDGDLELAPELGQPGHVEMMDGIFQPRDARLLERPARLAGASQ